MRLRFILFFATLLVIFVGVNLFVWRRATKAYALGKRGSTALGVLLLSGLLALFVGRWAARAVDPSLLEPSLGAALAAYGFAVELAVLIAAPLLGVERLMARLVTLFGGGAERASPGTAADEKPPSDEPAPRAPATTRRELVVRVTTGAALAVGTGSSLYGSLWGRRDYGLVEQPIHLERLGRRLEGFTIVHLSDIHVGLFVGERELASALDLTRRARPDQIVITGDLLDSDERYAEVLGAFLRRLGDLAPVAVIPGNHDYYAGIGPTLDTVLRAGAQVLLDRAILIGDRSPAGSRIVLCGVDDLWARRFGRSRGPNLDQALRDVPADLPRILLSHQPAFFEAASARVDLQLSGHTHAGQVNIGFQPAKLFLPHGWVEGHYRRGRGQLYVNRGFGTAGPPARIGAPPEVTKIVLTG